LRRAARSKAPNVTSISRRLGLARSTIRGIMRRFQRGRAAPAYVEARRLEREHLQWV
jgi:hypothetical protein